MSSKELEELFEKSSIIKNRFFPKKVPELLEEEGSAPKDQECQTGKN